MSGSGAAGGFNFQAVVGAFVAAHLLADDQLRWSTWLDLPISIAFEQGGAGDDIRVEFSSGNSYEVQVKRGLRADSNLEEALAKITSALNSQERGIIAVDPTSSGTVTQGLRNWLDGHRHGSPSSLPNSLAVRCQCLLQTTVQGYLERLHVIELDLEHSYSSHCRLAQALITPLIQNNSSPDAVMDSLISYCHHLMAVQGKCDARGLRDHLASRGHKLSPPLAHSQAKLVGMPARLPKLVGRDTLLDNIQDEFISKAGNFGQVLQGISGSGKSSIAAEYGFRYSNSYDQIIWVESSNILSATSYISSIVNQTKEASANSKKPLLLILDDLDNFQNAGNSLLPTLNELSSWHILATSTNDSWNEFFYTINIPSLDKEKAVEFLLGNLPIRDLDSANAIVEYVDRLPLALAQLSAYAAKTLEPWAKILKRLETEGTRLFGHRPASLRTYKETVATCWQIVLNKLEPESTKLLKLISFMNSKEIPLDLITNWFENVDPTKLPVYIVAVPDAISGLSGWLIIRRSESGIECHKLIQEVVRESMSSEERHDFSSIASKFFMGYLGCSGDAFRAYVRLKSHLLAFLSCEQIALPEHSQSILYMNLSAYTWRDDPIEGLYLIEASEDLARKTESEASLLLSNVLNTKGVIYKTIGALDDAISVFNEALQIVKGLSDDAGGLPAILDNTAQVFQKKGEQGQALKLYQEALEIRQAKSAHVDEVIVSLSNIVDLLIEMNLEQEAQLHLGELLAIFKNREQGEGFSPNYVAVCLRISRFCEFFGDNDTAVGLSLGALTMGRRVYGHGTKRYLEDALNSIAMWLRMGKVDVLEWFVGESLLTLPESICPIFWFNSACLCIAYRHTKIGIKLLRDFTEEYASTKDEFLQAVANTARMLIRSNEKTPDKPSLCLWLPQNVHLDLPADIPQPAAAVTTDWDTELHARTQDWG